MVDDLVAAFRRIYVFEGGAMFDRQTADLDAVQYIQRHFLPAGCHHTHAQPEGARRQGSIGGRATQARTSGRQVTGDVADDQIVHRGEGDEILHK